MIHAGTNEIDGVFVEVARKRCRRINLRVDSEGGVHLTVPKWWYPPSEASFAQQSGYRGATLRESETFLKSKWDWILKTRAKVLARPAIAHASVTDAEIETLRILLTELNDLWSARVGEPNVTWKIRKVKSVWGCCHWRNRYITYNAELAHAPRELVEYVVVHEFTHFTVHGHGPKFYALMDKRLPGWQILRKRLNKRDWDSLAPTAPQPPRVELSVHRMGKLVQDDLPGFASNFRGYPLDSADSDLIQYGHVPHRVNLPRGGHSIGGDSFCL